MSITVTVRGGSGKQGMGPLINAFWPEFAIGQLPANGNNVGTPGWKAGRALALATPTNSSAQTVTGTGTVKWGTGTGYRGRGCVVLAAGAAGTARQMINFASLTPALDSTVQSKTRQLRRVKRCVAPMIFEGGGNFLTDIGIQWSAANIGDYGILNGAAGFGFQMTAADEISFIRRAALGAGVVVSTVVRKTSAADLRNWHDYEVVVYDAEPGVEAAIEAYIDGLMVFSGKFTDAGMPLNPANNTLTEYGFGCALNARPNTSQLAVEYVEYTVGPTPADVGL